MDKQNFAEWLMQILIEKDMTQADLARKSGLKRQLINNYVNGTVKNPDPANLVAISKGLDIHPSVVFQAAGLFPENSDFSDFEEWKHILSQLPEDERDELLVIARHKLERNKKKEG